MVEVCRKTNRAEEALEKLLELCQKLKRIPLQKEIICFNIIGCIKTLNKICKSLGFQDYVSFCRHRGYLGKNDVIVNGEIKTYQQLNLDDLIVLFNNFYDKHQRWPNSTDCKQINSLPSWRRVQSICQDNNLNAREFYQMFSRQPVLRISTDQYDYFVKKYIEISQQRGRYLRHKELINNKFGLPNPRWFVKHCPDKTVKNFSQFVEWCGFRPKHYASKEKVVEIIYEMQSKLDRPLMQSDFENPTADQVSISYINKYWGNLNKMKMALGLEIVQANMVERQIGFIDAQTDLIAICEKISSEQNRRVITTEDITLYGSVSYGTYYKVFKNNNTSVRDFLESIGFKLQPCGVGYNYEFNDREVVYSKYEYRFSKYLRDKGFVFSVDYLRGINYSKFIPFYNGYMNIDYIINIHKSKTYIEIAGMLRDYKNHYYNNQTINNKIHESYRQDLIFKETMLKNAGLQYYIIFPEDCHRDFFDLILSA